jgi:hypothetical protein
MPTLVGQKSLQIVNKKLPFCYICGQILSDPEKSDRDHVPPKACIANRDKAHSPLILPTHKVCNASFKIDDERVGQFLSILHGRVTTAQNDRLERQRFSSSPVTQEGTQSESITNVDMYGVVARWVRAFHAALYMQPLPINTRFATELPSGVVSPTEEGYIRDEGRPRQRVEVPSKFRPPSGGFHAASFS